MKKPDIGEIVKLFNLREQLKEYKVDQWIQNVCIVRDIKDDYIEEFHWNDKIGFYLSC